MGTEVSAILLAMLLISLPHSELWCSTPAVEVISIPSLQKQSVFGLYEYHGERYLVTGTPPIRWAVLKAVDEAWTVLFQSQMKDTVVYLSGYSFEQGDTIVLPAIGRTGLLSFYPGFLAQLRIATSNGNVEWRFVDDSLDGVLPGSDNVSSSSRGDLFATRQRGNIDHVDTGSIAIYRHNETLSDRKIGILTTPPLHDPNGPDDLSGLRDGGAVSVAKIKSENSRFPHSIVVFHDRDLQQTPGYVTLTDPSIEEPLYSLVEERPIRDTVCVVSFLRRHVDSSLFTRISLVPRSAVGLASFDLSSDGERVFVPNGIRYVDGFVYVVGAYRHVDNKGFMIDTSYAAAYIVVDQVGRLLRSVEVYDGIGRELLSSIQVTRSGSLVMGGATSQGPILVEVDPAVVTVRETTPSRYGNNGTSLYDHLGDDVQIFDVTGRVLYHGPLLEEVLKRYSYSGRIFVLLTRGGHSYNPLFDTNTP